MDEARLRQELLRGRFMVSHAVGWEVIVDLDAPTFLLPTARVDGQALEIEEISTWFSVILIRSFLCGGYAVRCNSRSRR